MKRTEPEVPEEPYKASLPDIMDMALMLDGHDAPTRILMIIQRPDGDVRFYKDGVNQLEAIGLMEAVKVAMVVNVPREDESDD